MVAMQDNGSQIKDYNYGTLKIKIVFDETPQSEFGIFKK